jgi:hypothetical protein
MHMCIIQICVCLNSSCPYGSMKVLHMRNTVRVQGRVQAGKSTSTRSAGHMPRLDTIQMVEKAIKGDKVFSSKNQLWRSLPKAMQYPTLLTILDYLERSNKIIIEKDGSIVWTFVDSQAARKSLKDSAPI